MSARSVYRDGETWVTLARVTDQDGFAYATSGLTTIAVAVYDLSVGSGDIYVVTDPTVAFAAFDTLQTDYGWDEDSYGYNLRVSIAPNHVSPAPEGGHTYKIEIKVTTNTGMVRMFEHLITVSSEGSA